MGKLVVSQFVSLDGAIEDPVGIESLGRGAWSAVVDSGPEGGQFKVEELIGSEALLLGRATYEGYESSWPGRDGEYAEKINSMPKYVVSATLTDPEWENTTVIGADAPAAVARLKDEVEGRILIHGSAQLVHDLAEHDLVDEWWLMVFPVLLGAGKGCFGETSAPKSLTLAESRTVGDGVQILIYRAEG